MRIVSMIFIGALLSAFNLMAIPAVNADQTAYVLPANISMKLKPSLDKKLMATITPETGIPSNLKIRFTSSDGIKVITPKFKMERLNKAMSFQVEFEKTQIQEEKSWIKMLVEYEPDFLALLKKSNNKINFPDQDERKRLVDRVKEVMINAKEFTEGTFYRFPKE